MRVNGMCRPGMHTSKCWPAARSRRNPVTSGGRMALWTWKFPGSIFHERWEPTNRKAQSTVFVDQVCSPFSNNRQIQCQPWPVSLLVTWLGFREKLSRLYSSKNHRPHEMPNFKRMSKYNFPRIQCLEPITSRIVRPIYYNPRNVV